MKTYLSWSGGKDSTASVILAHEHNVQVDLIIISLPFFDKQRKIYADHPLHIDFIFNKAIPLFREWGYKVKILSSERDYNYWFFKCRKNGKKYGWLIPGRCKMNGEKVEPIKKYIKQLDNDGWKSIVGIGFDEPERLTKLHKRPNQISLLEQFGYTTIMAKELCKKYNLLSPLYNMGGMRQGCFFCPNAPLKEFVNLAHDYPNLWNELCALNEWYKNEWETMACKNFTYGLSFSRLEEMVNLINNNISIFDLIKGD